MMSGPPLFTGCGVGVGGAGGGALAERLLSPASNDAKEIPVIAAVATFLATAPAAGPSGIAVTDNRIPISKTDKSTFM